MPNETSSTVAERVEAGIQHFHDTMGMMPVQLKTMSERAPDVFAGYLDMRTWLMRTPEEGGAMPLKYKHLIFSLLDVVLDNQAGSENHARAALRRGLTIEEFIEGMVQVHMCAGVSVYGRTGFKVLDNILAEQTLAK